MNCNILNKAATLRLAALAAAVMAGPAMAASSLTIDPTPATITRPATDVTVTVVLTQDGTSNGADAVVNYDNTIFTAAATAQEGACIVDQPTGRVIMSAGGFTDTRDLCDIVFTRDAGAADGTYPLTFTTAVFATPSAGDQAVDGEIIIQSVNDAALAFNPASGGTVTFGTGTQNTTVSEAIDISVTGTGGSGTVDGCAFTGADAGAFTVTSSQPIVVAAGGTGSIDIDCLLDDVAQSATLTCDTNDGSGAGTATWQMSCPAGTAVPSPEFSSVPAAGALITCNGPPASVVNRSIEISNTGNPGAGSDLTFTCASSDPAFVIVSGSADTLAVGESATLSFTCATPATEADPANTGTIDCTSNGGAGTFNLSSAVVTAPPPVPGAAIIPANSLWSLLALFGVIAGLGALVIGLRRH